MKRVRFLTIIALGAFCGPASAWACDTFSEELSIISNGNVVGGLTAETAACKTEIKYRVSNNGRGPTYAERIVYGPKDIPSEYAVSGTSEFGGAVDETYTVRDGRAVWRSQADQGEMATDQRLYLVNDSSPYSLAVYARALLAAPGSALQTVPDGELRIVKVQEQTFTGAAQSIPVTFYRIEGRDIAPDYVVLDGERRVFATGPSGALGIRKGWEERAPVMKAELERLADARARELQATLAHKIDRPIRIQNVKVFDAASGKVGSNADVLIADGRITGIVPIVKGGRPGERVVDGEGGVLAPGLHDMHSHDSIDSGLLYLAAGVTTTRNMGANNDRLLKIVSGIRSGALAGPDIVYNGFIEGRSASSAQQGFIVDNVDAALDAVRWYARNGFWQIKIYNSVDPKWVKPIADLAHSLHMGVTGHIPAFTTPDAMIDAGYNEIAHANQLMLGWLLKPGEDTRSTLRLTALPRAADLDLASPPVKATIAQMQSRKVALDTTAVILEQLMMSRAGANPPSFSAIIDHLPIAFRRDTRRTYMPLQSKEEDDRYKAAFAKFIDLLRVLHANKITLLPGTDNGQGFALHRELELYAMAGIKPAEVLSIATLGMARYLGRDKEHGTIAVGKAADMVLLRDDPTQDISAVRSTRLVLKGGFMYVPDEIYRALSIKPFGTAPKIERK